MPLNGAVKVRQNDRGDDFDLFFVEDPVIAFVK